MAGTPRHAGVSGKEKDGGLEVEMALLFEIEGVLPAQREASRQFTHGQIRIAGVGAGDRELTGGEVGDHGLALHDENGQGAIDQLLI